MGRSDIFNLLGDYILRGLLTYISILASIIVVLVILGTKNDGVSQVENVAYPENELQFMSIVRDAASEATKANDLRKGEIVKARDSMICNILNNKEIYKWHGTISDISSTLSEDAIVEIKLPDGTKVGTWNNVVSDAGDNTIISKNSDVFNDIYELSIGDKVLFSGSFVSDKYQCARETSLTKEGGLLSPEFLFKFSSIKKI